MQVRGERISQDAPAASTADDAELVARAQGGDRIALETLLERYQPHLMRFGLRMCGNRQDAEDVVQESMMAAVRTLSGFRSDASLSTWLYTIARSFCIKQRRRSKFAPKHELSFDDPDQGQSLDAELDGSATPEERASEHELDRAVQVAILGLDEGQREVLVLRDVEGLSAPEVAEVTGLAVGAVKSKLHRARASLRRALEPILGELDSTPPPTTDCPDMELLFSRSLEGEVDTQLCQKMQEHVDDCDRCKRACKTLSSVLSTCQATPFPEVPPSVQASVRRAARQLSLGPAK